MRWNSRHFKTLLDTALNTAKKAGHFQRERFAHPKKIYFKGSIDLVTDVDKQCEEIIIKSLKTVTPDVDIMAEETRSESTGSTLWIVDPLDGTTNYAHGYPCFSVSIALKVEEDVTLGVVHNSYTGETYTAVKGQGAFKDGHPIRVSRTDKIEHALLCTGFPYDVGTSQRNNVREFTTVIQHAQGVRRDGSAALDLCRVAEGAFDGFWELKLKPWDVAAGALIAQEAGGIVTNFDGSAFDPFTDTIICTNGFIHDALKKLLNEAA